MADTLSSTTSGLDSLMATYFVKKNLPVLYARCRLYEFAERTPLPRGEGKVVKWNAWSNFAAVSVSLTEGTANSLAAASTRTVSATVDQWGRGVKPTDLVIDTASLPVIEGLVRNLTESAALSVDRVMQLKIFKNSLTQITGTKIMSVGISTVASAFHASGASAAAAQHWWRFPVVFGASVTRLSAVNKAAPSRSAQLSLYAIRKAVKELRGKNAIPFADGYFKGIANTDALADLRGDPTFVQWHANGGQVSHMEKGYVGDAEGVRFYESNNLPHYLATGHSCSFTFIFGQGAYGVTEINGGTNKGFEIIIKRPNPYDTSNPFNQWSTIAYKITMAAADLNVSAGRILITHDS